MLKKSFACIIAVCITVSMFVLPASSAEAFDKYVIRQLESFASEIDITSYVNENKWSLSKCNAEFLRILTDNPGLFFVGTEIVTTLSGTKSAPKYTYTKIKYTISKSQYPKKKKEFDAAAKKALENISKSMSDFEKALALHDYVILNTRYDTARPKNKSRTSYDALVGGLAVCQGYTLAYNYLLGLVGIESAMIDSTRMNHAWSYVKIGKYWYHVDVTNDDPLMNNKTDMHGRVAHTMFMLSDAAIKKAGHSGWDRNGLPAATNTAYDKLFFRNIESPMVRLGNYWYYIQFDENSPSSNENYKKPNANPNLPYYAAYADLYRYSFKTNSLKKLYTIDSTWFIWGTEDSTSKSWWEGNYSSLAASNGMLYFNDAKSFYSFDVKTNKAKLAFTPQNPGGYIYGFTMNGQKITYTVKRTPGDANSLKAVSL